jgi:membrane-bound serine protease (ClpP class)
VFSSNLWRGLLLAGAASLLVGATTAPREETVVEVIELRGLLDDARLTFLASAVGEAAAAGRELVVVQLDSPAVVGESEAFRAVAELVADPPVAMVLWLGPAPARAGGGAAQLLAMAPIRAAAPGAMIENWTPAVVRGIEDLVEPPAGLADPTVIAAPIPGLVDLTAPSIRQLLQSLDGMETIVGGQPQTLRTLTETEGGMTTLPVSFRQPGLIHRFLHLAAEPPAAFFFLVAGLTVAVFEFYALGPGLAAAVAALSLLLGGYGIAVLPVRPGAVGLTLAGIGLLTVGYQRGGVIGLTLLGTASMVVGGFTFVSGAPQVSMSPVGVAGSVLAVLFFYLLALPTVGRARLSTPTMGRGHLIGRTGAARVDLTPDGVVEVDQGRWPATSHREAGIVAGDRVRVVGVDGWRLEVEPEREI